VHPPSPREPLSPWPFAGLVGLACVAFLIGATRLAVAAPWWAVTLLALLWLGAVLVAITWFTTRPRAVALLPAVMVLVWVATVVGGARFLEWG
jgi:hypothetical protein